MKHLIKNAVVIAGGEEKKLDVLVSDGKIERIAVGIGCEADRVTDAKGLHLLAGFTDMHCHLREPGFEYKEDIESGLAAAVAGGFTSVCPMPNTLPCADNKTVINYVLNRSREVGLAAVYPIGAISKSQKGEQLAEIVGMRDAGMIAVSDDGVPVSDANLMRLCLEYIKPFGILAISHCEEKSLTNGGSANEGYNATVAGIKGITRAAEEVMTARDIILAETLNTKIHIAHVSTKGSVQLVREAKARGVRVTCETCPHYMAGDDSMILGYDTSAKVNPPLRELSDVEAILSGLADGTIDAIATDHAPHSADEKNVEFDLAPFGISGFETAFALAYTSFVHSGRGTLSKLSELMSRNPRRILGLDGGTIEKGQPADIVLADLKTPFVIDPSKFLSKGKNNPFGGRKVYGKIIATFVGGQIKYENGEII